MSLTHGVKVWTAWWRGLFEYKLPLKPEDLVDQLIVFGIFAVNRRRLCNKYWTTKWLDAWIYTLREIKLICKNILKIIKCFRCILKFCLKAKYLKRLSSDLISFFFFFTFLLIYPENASRRTTSPSTTTTQCPTRNTGATTLSRPCLPGTSRTSSPSPTCWWWYGPIASASGVAASGSATGLWFLTHVCVSRPRQWWWRTGPNSSANWSAPPSGISKRRRSSPSRWASWCGVTIASWSTSSRCTCRANCPYRGSLASSAR